MHICDHSIVTFGIIENSIGFSNTSYADSLETIEISFVDKFKSDICILQKGCDSKENNMKIKYANNYVRKSGMVDHTTCVYQFIYNETDKMTHR